MPQNTGQGEVQPINKDHVTCCQTSVARDFVVVAGLDDDKESSKGNRARFVNQATRTLILNKAALQPGDLNVYLSFRGSPDKEGSDGKKIRGHIGDDVHKELKKIVTERHGGTYLILDSADELLNFINAQVDEAPPSKMSFFGNALTEQQIENPDAIMSSTIDLLSFISKRAREKRLIKKLDLFTHGYPNRFEFAFKNSDKGIESRCLFKSEHVKKIKREKFDFETVVTSWSCRTGIGNDAEYVRDPMFDKSLAQLIANTAQVEVIAFHRRSLYAYTYGKSDEGFFEKAVRWTLGEKSKKEKTEEAEEAAVVKYDAEKENYQKAFREYEEKESARQARLEEYRKTPGNENASVKLGEPPFVEPEPPKKPMTDEAMVAVRNRMTEKKIEKRCGLPIKLDGAVMPVVAGNTPGGVKEGMFTYKPKAPPPSEETKSPAPEEAK